MHFQSLAPFHFVYGGQGNNYFDWGLNLYDYTGNQRQLLLALRWAILLEMNW